MSDLNDQIADVLAAVLPAARKATTLTGRSIRATLLDEIKPHIVAFVRENVTTSTLSDGRVKKWNVKLMFIMAYEGNEGEVIAETDTELVTGFGGIIEMVRDMAGQVHEDAGVLIEDLTPFSVKELKHKLNGLRPSISNSGGRAKTYIPYTVNHHTYSCVMHISRDGMPLTTE